MPHIDIDIVEQWPHYKLIVRRGNQITEKIAQYDTATVQFEPLVLNALAATMREAVATQNKRRGEY